MLLNDWFLANWTYLLGPISTCLLKAMRSQSPITEVALVKSSLRVCFNYNNYVLISKMKGHPITLGGG